LKYTHLFILILLLSGCAGLTTHFGTEASHQQFSYYQAKRGEFSTDKATTLRAWGNPIKITKQGENEVWKYRGGTAWRGIVIWVLVPIPLMAPVGSNYVNMLFSPTGELISGTAEGMDEKGVVCVLLTLECNPEPHNRP